MPDVPFDELVDRVATVLGEERPDVGATFGPDGITGHPDHIRIGEAATAAFLRFAGDGGPGFRRLVYGGIRQSVIDRGTSGGSMPASPSITSGASRTSGSTLTSTPPGWHCWSGGRAGPPPQWKEDR